MRINKFISDTGICSRREADKLVKDKKVTINGLMATLGDNVKEDDDIRIDGTKLIQKSIKVYIALNKPVGVTCTTELHIKDNIVDFIGHEERIFPIGRLDKDSEGLILLTNDGDIVNKVLRAENNHEKEYIVTTNKIITQEFIHNISNGVKIEGKETKKCVVKKISDNIFKIILTEGRNRQIRKMCASFGYQVKKLKRVRIMNILLDELPKGKWRNLTEDELEKLFIDINYII